MSARVIFVILFLKKAFPIGNDLDTKSWILNAFYID